MAEPSPRKRPRFRRRQYIINKEFQFRFIAHMILVALVIIGCVYLTNWFFFADIVAQAKARGLPENHIFFLMMDSHYRFLNTVFFWTSMGIISGLAVFGVFYSHRIAGPLYRLRMDLDAMADGAPPKDIKFRKGDRFQEIPTAFNRLMHRLTTERQTDSTKKAG